MRPALLFIGAVAAFAAACGDLLVESLSNHGYFGPGRFTDGSNVDIAPIAVAGSALLFLALLMRVRRLVGRRSSASFALPPVGRTLPLILLVQIVVLWAMETAEQYLVAGHGLGGTIWLGGPIAASLTLHAAICAAVAYAARRAIALLEPQAVRLIRRLLTLLALVPDVPTSRARALSAHSAPSHCFLTEIAKRGPPAALWAA